MRSTPTKHRNRDVVNIGGTAGTSAFADSTAKGDRRVLVVSVTPKIDSLTPTTRASRNRVRSPPGGARWDDDLSSF